MRSKKIGCIALVILLAFCMLGCEDDDDAVSSAPKNVPAGAPSNVKAVVFQGGIQVTWDPSVNAQSYDVYRRTVGGTGADAESRFIGQIIVATGTDLNQTNRGGLTYNDVVSFNNQLENGWQYEYTIVANGRQSLSGRFAVFPLDPDEYTMSAAAKSNRVTANIPAQGSKLATPRASMTRITTWPIGGTGDETDSFQVTWERVPGARYQVGYGYTLQPNSPHHWTLTSTTATLPLDNSGYFARFGSISVPYTPTEFISEGGGYGKRVEVRAFFPDNYYAPSDTTAVIYYDNNPRYEADPALSFSV